MNPDLKYTVSRGLAGLVILLGFCPAMAATTNHKPHVHGVALLTLAIEDPTSASIDLDVPGDSIFGFEHRAMSEPDKKIQTEALGKLRDRAQEVIRFSSELGCVTKTEKVGLEKDEADHPKAQATGELTGEHQDVNASYTVHCKRSITGSLIRVGLIQLFPKIKTVTVQILAPSSQSKKTVHYANETVTLPDF